MISWQMALGEREMGARNRPNDSETLRQELVKLLTDFRDHLASEDLRGKVLALLPACALLRRLGTSLLPNEEASAARDRILFYLRTYSGTVIAGDELMVVSGIQEWARRLRELRVQFGWPILSGTTVREMASEGDPLPEDVGASVMKPSDYVLLRDEQDREAAHRWNVANGIRRKRASVKDKILEFLRDNVGAKVSGEELRYVAGDRTEWARRVRELRTEQGWPVVTKNTGRPDLPVGTYVLEADRQSPREDRAIPDTLRGQVLRRDGYRCTECKWDHSLWNPSDPRHLELHHVVPHACGGNTIATNLTTLCNICHDRAHVHSD